MKVKTEKKLLGLYPKLVICFLAFSFVILGSLWLFQVGLFEEFYRGVTTERIDRFCTQLKSTSVDSFDGILAQMGESDNICTEIYRIRPSSLSLVADYHTEKSCFVHSIRDEHILQLYRIALTSEEKSYRTYLSSEEIDRYFPDKPSQQSVIVIDGIPVAGLPVPFQPSSGQSSDSILSVFVFSSGEESYFCLMSALVIPEGSTTQTLSFQLATVTAVALLLSLLLSLLLARSLAGPLGRLNRNAVSLPSGEFRREGLGGCREIGELEHTLTKASEEIKKVDTLRKELIANVSHDLRTPLTLISGYSEMMQDFPEEITKENLQVIVDETARLSRLVTDLLDNSKLEAGMDSLTPSLFDLSLLTQGIVNRIREMTKGSALQLECSSAPECFVEADEGKLSQAIYNLIGNAINYGGTPPCVKVLLKKENGRARLEIRDNGEGIPADKLKHIWERYYKSNEGHKREKLGTGLGLAITKKVFQMHGLSFGVESQEGKGSCFWFEIPVKAL